MEDFCLLLPLGVARGSPTALTFNRRTPCVYQCIISSKAEEKMTMTTTMMMDYQTVQLEGTQERPPDDNDLFLVCPNSLKFCCGCTFINLLETYLFHGLSTHFLGRTVFYHSLSPKGERSLGEGE